MPGNPDTRPLSAETEAAMREVDAAFRESRKAHARVSRCTREDSLKQARAAAKVADKAYRAAADKRDRLVDLDRARKMQTGDEIAQHHNRSHDGPAIPVKPGPIVEIRQRGAVAYTDGIAHGGDIEDRRRITTGMRTPKFDELKVSDLPAIADESREFLAMALLYAASRLEVTGEAGTSSSATLLRQMASEMES